MYIKVHTTGERYGNRYVVAVCDEDLIGKRLKDDKYDITVSERFYKGDKISEEKLIIILKEAINVNLIGEKSIEAGIKAGVIKKENVVKIKGVPHAQAVTITF